MTLPSVRGDDGNVGGVDSAADERGHKRAREGCFGRVGKRGVRVGGALFGTREGVEGNRQVAGPSDSGRSSFVGRDAVDETTLVEGEGRKERNGGMHAMLHKEDLRRVTQVQEALEQGDAESRSLEVAGSNDGAELSVVADKGDVLDADGEGDEHLRLEGLRRLIDDKEMKGE